MHLGDARNAVAVLECDDPCAAGRRPQQPVPQQAARASQQYRSCPHRSVLVGGTGPLVHDRPDCPIRRDLASEQRAVGARSRATPARSPAPMKVPAARSVRGLHRDPRDHPRRRLRRRGTAHRGDQGVASLRLRSRRMSWVSIATATAARQPHIPRELAASGSASRPCPRTHIARSLWRDIAHSTPRATSAKRTLNARNAQAERANTLQRLHLVFCMRVRRSR